MAMKVWRAKAFIESPRVQHLLGQDEIQELRKALSEHLGGLYGLHDMHEVPSCAQEAIEQFIKEVRDQFDIDLSKEIPL
ncbi:MAG: hypothetical protein ACYCZ7_01675 [Minisyncoccota bacterium]